MDTSRLGVVLVVDGERRLLGTVTDGDVRRAVLAYTDLGEPVSVLLINAGESPEPIREWTGRKRFAASILLDTDGEVQQRYGVAGIPQLFIIDQRGAVIYRHSGYRGGLERNLRLILRELLAGQEASNRV